MIRYRYNAGSITRPSINRWQPTLRNHDANTSPIELIHSPEPEWIDVDDGDRSFTANTQDIHLYWAESMADASLSANGTATGYTVYVNGVSYQPTYLSGSGTASWMLRIAALVKNGDVVTLSYDPATGNTTATADSAECVKLVEAGVENDLSKRVRFTLCDSNDALVVETVKAALFDYASNVVTNDSWMVKTDKASVTTDATGQFDMQYNGTARVGSSVFCAVIRASESLIVAATIT